MLPRLVLIFVFLVLIALAVKKGLSPTGEIVERVSGYPAPVALKKAESVSDEEFLKNLPSAADYALASNSPEQPAETKAEVQPVKRKFKIAKRTVATKMKRRKH